MPVLTDGTTFVSSLGLGFTLLMCLLILVLPRRFALLPVIVLTCYMTMGERVMISGLNFTMIRILTLAGWLRILCRGEIRFLRLNILDKVMIVWVISGTVAYVLLWQSSQALIYRLGGAYDAFGLYFLFRCLIRDLSDIKRISSMVAILIVPLAVAMLAEKITGRNAFAIFGGVMEFTRLRDGSLRCQGPFAHPILAGSFAATNIPFFLALWWRPKKRFLAAVAVMSALTITVTAASSGPFLACLAGIGAFMMWSRRSWLRPIRWAILLGLTALHLTMKSPVWFLIARADVFGGSTGWHRAALIDAAVKHFGDWWLLGIKNTGVWAPQLADVTNQYIWQGVQGGLLTMLLFILIIVLSFRSVGRMVGAMKRTSPLADTLCVWALGASLFAHVLNYLSITYFDQNFVNWYLLLAMISTAAGAYVVSVPRSSVATATRPVEVKLANSWTDQTAVETAPGELRWHG